MTNDELIKLNYESYIKTTLPLNASIGTIIGSTAAFLIREIADNRDRLDELERRHELLVESINERLSK
jgi:hypothetical protein